MNSFENLMINPFNKSIKLSYFVHKKYSENIFKIKRLKYPFSITSTLKAVEQTRFIKIHLKNIIISGIDNLYIYKKAK